MFLSKKKSSAKFFLKNFFLTSVFISTLVLAGCGKPKRPKAFTIVATTTIIADAVRQIVKDRAHVISLMGPGVDPHAYKATRRDLDDISGADIVFFNGLHLEGKMADVLESAGARKNFHAVANGIEDAKLLRDETFEVVGIDPHVWFDVNLWRDCVLYISSVIKNLDPANADFYEQNAAVYVAELDALHSFIQNEIQKIPRLQRVLISAHDAFNYFGRAYDMDVRGLQGISTVAECGLRDISEMVAMIVNRKIKAVFLETSVSEGPIRAVVEGCLQSGHRVSVGGHLFSDALGNLDEEGGTYVGMMRANVRTVVGALA